MNGFLDVFNRRRGEEESRGLKARTPTSHLAWCKAPQRSLPLDSSSPLLLLKNAAPQLAAGLVFLAAVTLTGCSRNGHTGSGVFNDPAKASAASLAEAQRIDAVQALYQDGLYERARTALDQVLADGSRHPQAFLLKAQLTRQAGDAAGAIPWADRAIAASPAWIEPRILLAQIYLGLERWSAAADVFAAIERLAPKGPWGPYGQGAVAARRGDTALASRFVDTALERDPDHLPSLELRVGLARMGGDRVTEERALARVAALDPNSASVRARLGELAQAGGRLEEARRHLLRAYELEPRPTTAQQLAQLARLLGDGADEQRWNARSGVSPVPTEAVSPQLQQ
jgi:tetratricopeptide (TPR) repeat protein